MNTSFGKQAPKFRKVLFWDIDYSALNWNEHAHFIITRIMHRGTLDDWKELRQFYGKERIQNCLPTIKWEDPKTEHFFKLNLNAPK